MHRAHEHVGVLVREVLDEFPLRDLRREVAHEAGADGGGEDGACGVEGEDGGVGVGSGDEGLRGDVDGFDVCLWWRVSKTV